MDNSRLESAMVALESATDTLVIALARRPEPDLERAGSALRARADAIRRIGECDRRRRPPDTNARLRRILETDRIVGEQLQAAMEALREKMAGTRRMVEEYDRSLTAPYEAMQRHEAAPPSSPADPAAQIPSEDSPGEQFRGVPRWPAQLAALKLR